MVARRVCLGCEVRIDCLTDALVRDEPWGIWGGFGRQQRVLLARRLRSGAGRGLLREVGRLDGQVRMRARVVKDAA